MNQRFSYIRKRHPRVDGEDKVTGKTRFLTDMKVEGMVFAAPVYSSIPFGNIRSIDKSDAISDPDYISSVFAEDIPNENQVGVIIEDQPLLAKDIVRYIGDTIGLVVATSPEAAFLISKKVRIEYVEKKPYLSIDDSKQATDNFIHDNNIACTHQVIRGDIEKGFQESDIIVEETFRTPYQEHYYLEPQGCIAIPEENDRMVVYGSLQCPFYVQKAVCKVLGLPYRNVKVIQAPTGGAFGGKEDVPSEVCARTALAAKVLGRPVKMVYNRYDDVQLTSKRHPFQMKYKVGVTSDGRLIAAEVLLEENAGAYATLSSVVSYRATAQAMGPYVIPNIKVHSTSFYTNLPPTGAFRGFGSPQATFGHERMMDILAERLNMDPVEFRLKNILKPGEETLTGHKLHVSVGAEETIIRARDSADWSQNRNAPRKEGRYVDGIGISTSHYGNCLGAAGWHMDGSGAKIQIHRDGSVFVSFGLVEMGQGSLTVVTQMTAEALGISPERISVLPTDTTQVPDSGPSVASRVVVMTGNAIRDAAGKLMPVLISAAAELLKTKPEQVEIKNDRVREKQTGESLSFDELTEHLFVSNHPMVADGWWHVPELNYDQEKGVGEAYFTYSYSTHIAKVRVDTLTGQVKVNKIWAAHDVGRAINPAGLEAQVEGGTAQGIGWALTENFRIENGKVITPNLSTYLLPTAMDVAEVETILIEDPEPEGPWGAKGIGEPAIIPTAAAIANAVTHAIGVQMNEIPMTLENVLNQLNRSIETDKNKNY